MERRGKNRHRKLFWIKRGMKLTIIGPPGSGKSSQADLLAKKLRLKHITIGELLRKEEKKHTKLGEKIEKIIDKGNLVPSALAWNIVKKELNKNYILDGFPRELIEAKILDKNTNLDAAIFINVNNKEILRRLTNRWYCSCGMNYNFLMNKPKKNHICDKCSRKLLQREDDKPNIIKKRIKIYRKETKPVIDFYRKKRILITVNGLISIKEILKEIISKLNKNLYKPR